MIFRDNFFRFLIKDPKIGCSWFAGLLVIYSRFIYDLFTIYSQYFILCPQPSPMTPSPYIQEVVHTKKQMHTKKILPPNWTPFKLNPIQHYDKHRYLIISMMILVWLVYRKLYDDIRSILQSPLGSPFWGS
jgi:hypothetical protein